MNDRPMTEILKAADTPLPAKPANGQTQTAPPPMTVAEATEKLVNVMDHMKIGTDNEIEDVITYLSNLKQKLALQVTAFQTEARATSSLMLEIKDKCRDVIQIAQQIEKNHLQ